VLGERPPPFRELAFPKAFHNGTELHLAENTFPLHLFLERLQRLVDIVVSNENLHAGVLGFGLSHRMME